MNKSKKQCYLAMLFNITTFQCVGHLTESEVILDGQSYQHRNMTFVPNSL